MFRQNNFSNICSRCGIVCCKGARPPLSLERIKIIDRKAVRSSWFSREEYAFPKETSRGCIFLDDEKRCTIQSFKPETCVAGPITFDINLGRGTIEYYLKIERICPLAGTLYRDNAGLQRHLTSAKREILNLVRNLSGKELRAILKVEEPDTFKIDEDPLDPAILEKLKNGR